MPLQEQENILINQLIHKLVNNETARENFMSSVLKKKTFYLVSLQCCILGIETEVIILSQNQSFGVTINLSSIYFFSS